MIGSKDIENTIAVLFGGRSSEHEISLRSAVYVLKNFPEKLRIIPVGISRFGEIFSVDGTFTSADFKELEVQDLALICQGKMPRNFSRGNIAASLILPMRTEILADFAEGPMRILNLEAGTFFPVLHGPNGEDGRWQGVFELAEVPYVGCDLRASVIGIDKNIQKILAMQSGIRVGKYVLVEAEEWKENRDGVVANVAKTIGFPNFVKPNALGSAVGVSRATDQTNLAKSLDDALRFDNKALVEEPMIGTEVECAFLGTGVKPRISVAGEIAPKDFYSYDAKYQSDDGAEQYVPARLDSAQMKDLQSQAAVLARAFSLEGLCRIDFWYRTTPVREFVFNEVNTLPGLTSVSMFPKLWEHDGVNGTRWIGEIILAARARHALQKQRSFETH